MEVRSCPGCSTVDHRLTDRVGREFGTRIGEFNFHQPEYHIKLCTFCGLYYKSHVISGKDLAYYYSEVDFTKWEFSGLFPTEKILLNHLSQLKAGSKILDYGCSSGRLLSSLSDVYRCYGVEINESAAAVAASKGFELIAHEAVPTVPFFDAIILCDVFEHLSQPTDTLRRLCISLRENGLLFWSPGMLTLRCVKRTSQIFGISAHQNIYQCSEENTSGIWPQN